MTDAPAPSRPEGAAHAVSENAAVASELLSALGIVLLAVFLHFLVKASGSV